MGDTDGISRAKMFAVVLVWNDPSVGGWVGWLTTTDRQVSRFLAEDLLEDSMHNWLATLPGWEPDALAFAVYYPGLHLVWRSATV